MPQTAVLIVTLTLMLLGLPLAGLYSAGIPPGPYLQFPPQTEFVRHTPFRWSVFAAYAAFIGAVVTPFLVRWFRSRRPGPSRAEPRLFPWWGWAGVGSAAVAWVLAWSRFPWFSALQPHTFTGLWLSYIVVVNALAHRSSGKCLLTHRTGLLAALFPVSAAFWWFFEFLNRFVQNWYYSGSRYGPWMYFALATLSFSTVLPAVASTWDWIRHRPRLDRAFGHFVPIAIARPRLLCWAVLAAAGAGLWGIGIWPDLLFPLLWVSPLLIVVSVQALFRQRHVFSDLARGDWRVVVSSAVAALVCGLFWEMWNYHSLARWQYSVPYVERFTIFEMPLLGFAGYLPFGLECMAVADAVSRRFAKGSLFDGYAHDPSESH
ncbi:MAG: hypothetical protein LJE65_01880 [Desulfobacteraceae bacterium]|nr:hypothetical protein [Desulfobacteraceae bacterium]